MNTKRSVAAFILVPGIFLTLGVVLLSAATLPDAQAQGGATDQQQTIQAVIDQRFTQTAHPQIPGAATQTAQAVLNQAMTATAAFNSTVNAQFNQLLVATAQSGLSQTYTNSTG